MAPGARTLLARTDSTPISFVFGPLPSPCESNRRQRRCEGRRVPCSPAAEHHVGGNTFFQTRKPAFKLRRRISMGDADVGGRRQQQEEGVAIVVALMATTLLLALGAGLILATSTESMIAANFRASGEALYAADAVLERALTDLRDIPDWTQALDGTVASSFTDGQPFGVRQLSDGSAIDLGRVVNLANCQKLSLCTGAEMDARSAERPWGPNNPRWRVFAFGPLAALGDAVGGSPFYVVALIADDSSENDADPSRDGASLGPPNEGAGVVTLRGEAFGTRGSRRTVEATVERVDMDEANGSAAGLRVRSWREVSSP